MFDKINKKIREDNNESNSEFGKFLNGRSKKSNALSLCIMSIIGIYTAVRNFRDKGNDRKRNF